MKSARLKKKKKNSQHELFVRMCNRTNIHLVRLSSKERNAFQENLLHFVKHFSLIYVCVCFIFVSSLHSIRKTNIMLVVLCLSLIVIDPIFFHNYRSVFRIKNGNVLKKINLHLTKMNNTCLPLSFRTKGE